MAAVTGALVLVATPIGNLGDLSPRAALELAGADLVACEDTRRTGSCSTWPASPGVLCSASTIHTEAERTAQIMDRLQRGERVVVVSDAGTPAVSDPGERLVRAAVGPGHVVEVVPGPSAVLAALVGSGLATNRFCFEGFLSRRRAPPAPAAWPSSPPRSARWSSTSHPTVSPAPWPTWRRRGAGPAVVVARELTKLHEEWWRGTLAEAQAWVAEHRPRGEVVLVVDGGAPPPAPEPEDVADAVAAGLAGGATVKDVAVAVAARLGVPRRAVYRWRCASPATVARRGHRPVDVTARSTGHRPVGRGARVPQRSSRGGGRPGLGARFALCSASPSWPPWRSRSPSRRSPTS